MAKQVGPQERKPEFSSALQVRLGDEDVLGEFHQGPQAEIQPATRPDIRLQPIHCFTKTRQISCKTGRRPYKATIMKHLVRVTLLLLTLSPLIVQAFDGWPGDQSIAHKDSGALSKAYENAPIQAVFQVSDRNPDSWRVTLNSAIGTMNALGDKKTVIEIVAFGPGIDGLKRGSEWSELVSRTLDAGVDIIVSEASMAVRHYTHEDMLPNLKYVPAGAVEILQKQKMGYFYLRP